MSGPCDVGGRAIVLGGSTRGVRGGGGAGGRGEADGSGVIFDGLHGFLSSRSREGPARPTGALVLHWTNFAGFDPVDSHSLELSAALF